MENFRTLCGRDVFITINGKRLLQAESAELRKKNVLHRVRSCFCNDDAALVEGKREYKLNLTGIRFEAPFENCNFYDLDHFTVQVAFGDIEVTLEGCLWDDFGAVADREKFREHISISALRMITEEIV